MLLSKNCLLVWRTPFPKLDLASETVYTWLAWGPNPIKLLSLYEEEKRCRYTVYTGVARAGTGAIQLWARNAKGYRQPPEAEEARNGFSLTASPRNKSCRHSAFCVGWVSPHIPVPAAGPIWNDSAQIHNFSKLMHSFPYVGEPQCGSLLVYTLLFKTQVTLNFEKQMLAGGIQ